MSYASAAMAVLLFGLATLKHIGVITSSIWVLRHGPAYHQDLLARDSSHMSPQEYWAILEANSASAVFPFGVRRYKLDRFRYTQLGTNSYVRRLLSAVAALIGVLFHIVPVAVMCCGGLILLSYERPTDGAPRFVGTAAAAALCLLMVAYPVVVAVQLACSYARLGSYGGAFYRPQSYGSDRERGQLINEMRVIGFLVMLAYATSATALLFVGSRFGSFDGVRSRTDGDYSFFDNLGNALYMAPFGMMMEDAVAPKDGLGKLVSFLLGVQGGALVLFGLAAVLALPNLMPSVAAKAFKRSHENVSPPAHDQCQLAPSSELNESPGRPKDSDMMYWLIAAAAGAAVLVLTQRLRRRTKDGGRSVE